MPGESTVRARAIPRTSLAGLLACACVAGCQGLERRPDPAPRATPAGSAERPYPSRSGRSQARNASPDEPAGALASPPQRAEPGPVPLQRETAAAEVKLAAWRGPDELPPPTESILSESVLTEPEPDQAARRAGQEAPSTESVDAEPLSLDELQRLAAASNPTLRQAYALVEQARGNHLQVGLYPNPTVEAERAANDSPFDMFNVFVTQEIVTARKLRLNRAVASFDVERAQWEAEAQILKVSNEVQIRYIAALGARRRMEVAEDLWRIARDGVRASEELLAAEQVSEADALQARLQESQTEIALRNARFQASAAWKRLGDVVGRPDLPVRPLVGNLEDDVPDLDWDAARRQLLDHSPLLHAARARVMAAQAQARRERAQPIPNLQLTGGLGRTFSAPEYMMYTLQLGITLPVFDRNLGNIAAAESELRAAQAEVRRIELALRDGLARAFRRYLSTRNQARTYRDTILMMAERNLSLALERYEEGEFDFLRVLTARHDLFEAKINYITALVDLRIAAIEIQGLLLTGGLDPVDSSPTLSNNAGQTTAAGR